MELKLSKPELAAVAAVTEMVTRSGVPPGRWGLTDLEYIACARVARRAHKAAKEAGLELDHWPPATPEARQAWNQWLDENAELTEADRAAIWRAWGEIPDGTLNAVYVIAERTHVPARLVASVIYPGTDFGPWVNGEVEAAPLGTGERVIPGA